PPDRAAPRGYVELLRVNRDFRHLWLGQIVSQLGDWLDYVALFTLLLELTGSGTAAAGMLVARFLPGFFVSPLAGVVVDRAGRKLVMIAADLGRSVLVLGLLLVDSADDVWLAYAVVASVVVLTSFFEPARSATIPNVVEPADLVTANALSSITWSVNLAVGAAVGGFLTAAAGYRTAIVVDAASFALSAWLVARVVVPRAVPRTPPARRTGLRDLLGLADLAEGAAFLRARPPLALVAIAKALWSLAGGVILLHGIFGERVYAVGGSAAAGIGLLATARGLGTALGPLVARRLAGSTVEGMTRAIGVGFFVAGAFYLAFAWVTSWPLAALALVGGHMGGSTIWVFSTVLLQRLVPDALRGRVFGAELALMTLAMTASNLATGFALDGLGWSPRALAALLGAWCIAPGTLWLLAQRSSRLRLAAP
ncbi:MAG: MFS transporter, partial [Thermodesulfobacteriota bacterium]